MHDLALTLIVGAFIYLHRRDRALAVAQLSEARAHQEKAEAIAGLEKELRQQTEVLNVKLEARVKEAREQVREFAEHGRALLLIGDGSLAGGTQINHHCYFELSSQRGKNK